MAPLKEDRPRLMQYDAISQARPRSKGVKFHCKMSHGFGAAKQSCLGKELDPRLWGKAWEARKEKDREKLDHLRRK